ncbi:NADP-dependent oxidoreductase [Acerihabitans arboris]|uniref:Zinc-binding dehydrogenase n=1 Tax=Acerihabitans arboris TaxID=2691583 RepID=A0A845SNK0_9GAMM|nr:NADP-dependent oxidoreductase [Acerihabitans arboris]NDL62795.1 zinc-binding dehydrogenase [Acerihabitans arboris]
MNQNKHINRRIVLASRPTGAPVPGNFRLETSDIPQPGDRQVLLRTVFLSLDPYMRGRMSAAESYASPVELDAVMGAGTVSRVETSNHPDFAPGDWVLGYAGWQDYALSDGGDIKKLPADALAHPSRALGVLGMPGFTGYMGLMDIGQPKPGETLVVAAASGAVGSVVGQVARLEGCRTVGIAGGKDKCRYAMETLGFDACIDRRDADFAEQLARACPRGIDIYFENVGGAVFDAVIPLLNTSARIPLCGLIANYNMEALPDGKDRLPFLQALVLRKRIRMQGFIISLDYGHRYDEFIQAMGPWVNAGKVQMREDRIDGLEHAPLAFIGLLAGKNFGKLVVRVGSDSL